MKKENKDLWLKALKEELEDYSEPIPTGGWERLEQSLNAAHSTPKRIVSWKKWAYIGAAASIVLLFGIGSLLMVDSLSNTDKTDYAHQFIPNLNPDLQPEVSDPLKTITAISPVESVESKDSLVQIDKKTPFQGKREETSFQAIKKQDLMAWTGSENVKNEVSARIVESKENNEELVTVEDSFTESEENRTEKSEENLSETNQNSKISTSRGTSQRTTSRSSSDKLQLPTAIKSDKKRSKGWAMGLSAGSAGLMANGTGGTSSMLQMSSAGLSLDDLKQLDNGAISFPAKSDIVFMDGIPYRLNSGAMIEYSHNQPITVGFSVRKYFNEKLSLSMGLTYTLLSSDMKVLGAKNNQKIAQKFHYIGIPLKVNYDFVSYKSLHFYATAGGSIERAIYGKQGGQKVTNNKFQFSVLGGLGAQVNFTRNVGFYVEPGLAYFFKDGSNFETIRSDRRFNFDINAGLRLSY